MTKQELEEEFLRMRGTLREFKSMLDDLLSDEDDEISPDAEEFEEDD